MLIVMLDFLHREASVYSVASQGHVLSAAFSVVLLGFLAFNLLLSHNGLRLAIGHVDAFTPIALVFYLVAMQTVFRYERAQRELHVGEIAERHGAISLRRALAYYALHSALVVAAAMRLPFTAQHLALAMGWNNSFVGASFVALTTSLPEVVVTFAALRIGALDMAIADLFGSNLFDLAIVAWDDLAYTEGPLLRRVSPMHAISALSAIMMTGIAIIGLLYRPKARLFRTVGWSSLIIFCLYVVNMSVLYLYRE